MTAQTRWTVMVALMVLLLAACGQAASTPEPFTKNAAGYIDITVQQLAEMLPGKNFTLINVHVPYEGEIEQTNLNIPFDQIADYQGRLPAKDAPIVLYCRSGSMSTMAAETLVGLGYTNVMELDGGYKAWQGAGHELLTRPDPDSAVSPSEPGSGPKILFEGEAYDLGDLPVDQLFTAQFNYSNVGDTPLVIEEKARVETIAGC